MDRKTVNVQEASAGEQGVKVSLVIILILCVHLTLHKQKRERKN